VKVKVSKEKKAPRRMALAGTGKRSSSMNIGNIKAQIRQALLHAPENRARKRRRAREKKPPGLAPCAGLVLRDELSCKIIIRAQQLENPEKREERKLENDIYRYRNG
jgi:hypothetical protein